MLRRLAFRLPPHPASVPLARRRAHDHLAAWGLPERGDGLDEALLLVSELVTNAVTHASAGEREVEVAVTALADGSCFIEVSDGDPRLPEPRPAASCNGENGRGLRLVDAFAEAWGVWRRGRYGKTVWALVRHA
ncbi:ATP-binding protein [Streptomyces sp. NPDC059009]|uniref:ATP-binding protein n=1 Tax=Streptomyces sp. NPDC059009 TaxID=3346694 RepID=UPI0036B21826